MDWLKVSIKTTHEGIDEVTALLIIEDINGFEIVDNIDFLEFLEQNKNQWDYVDEQLYKEKNNLFEVQFYVSDNDFGKEQLDAVESSLERLKNQNQIDVGPLSIAITTLNENDWADSWKQYFRPIPIGEKLVVVPSWDAYNPQNRVPLLMDPGMLFGTGQHSTTKLCLEVLDDIIKQNDTVLDLGCGSSILSIGALLLGASTATAIDIDKNAVSIGYKNLELNNIEKGRLEILATNILEDEKTNSYLTTKKYTVVVANIVADVIIMLSKMVKDYLIPGGIFVASGIIIERKAEVMEAVLKSGLVLVDEKEDNGWVCLVYRREN